MRASAFTLMYIPSRFLVPGDATTTASRIAAAPGLYRLGVFADLMCGVFGWPRLLSEATLATSHVPEAPCSFTD